MTGEPRFLTLSEVLEIHDEEIAKAGGLSGIRDIKALESALGAPQASFNGEFLLDLIGTKVIMRKTGESTRCHKPRLKKCFSTNQY